MTDQGLFSLFLFLHVLGAIVAFGPALAFGVIGAYAGKEPQHSNFAVRLTEMLSRRVVIPVALTLPLTGAGIILVRRYDLASRDAYWLDVAIVLYAILILYAIFVQLPAAGKLISLTSGGPPPGAPGGAPAGAQGGPPPAPGARPGPPPHIVAALTRVKQGGIIMSILVVVIVLLMVVKPRF